MRKPVRVKTPALLCAAWVMLILSRCSFAPFSGGGTEGGNVSGLFFNDDGSTSAMVLVQLVPADYDPGAVNHIYPIFTAATATDGSYSFSRVPKGNYSVQAVHPTSGKRSLISGIVVADQDVPVPTDTLRDPGIMKIFIPGTANTATGYFFVPGTTVYGAISGASEFILVKSVPAVTLPAVSYSETGTSSSNVIRYNVSVPEADTVVVAHPEWRYAQQIRLNTSATGAGISENVFNFPVLIRLTKSNFDFSTANPGGSDIRFAKSDSAFLRYEIEQWDAANGRAALWVNVDTVFGNNSIQCITLYWGNDSAIGSSNSTEVFDTGNGFTGVWHMNENPDAGVNSIKDRTLNNYNATPVGGMTAANIVDGVIGKGLNFDGNDDYLNAGRTVNLTGSYSVGLWVNANDLTTYRRFIFKQTAYTLWYDVDTHGIRMEHFDGISWRGIMQDGGAQQPMSEGTWYYIVGAYDGDKVRLYVNGELKTASNSIGVNPQANQNYLSLGDGEPQRNASGTMDEMRIENVNRSADWIKLSYMNQRSDDKLVVFK
jgi:hypothetical protein